ncbi:hypothetical protein [Thermosediminibacter litoriperuensis]|uniref:Uncharacterized protein n=1 Tax=Thermosediminibacter litoriperuensis TaxID=291989 RepID=A0A5S5AY77_9FIRM|nr:hypothetical protein [Thermosediminibacter litoriperuensis]TYP58827.1 hypothetical protein LZ11_00283 [Thermosediminibacter litoriperuensis]
MKTAKTMFIILLVLLLVVIFINGYRKDFREPASGDNKPEVITERPGESDELSEDETEKPEEPEAPEALKGQAVYIGQIDDNSIEVKEGDSFQVYRLAPEIKDRFDSFNLKENDRIQFMYYVNENNQRVMTELKKMP